MPDLPIVLFVIFIVLTMVTLVGHGIWVLLAALFGGGTKNPGRACPFCARLTPESHDRCDWCGKDLAGSMARELNDLDVLGRHLQRFRQRGKLEPEAVDRLLSQLQEYRRQLLHPAEKRAAQTVAALIIEEAEPERPIVAPPATPVGSSGLPERTEVHARELPAVAVQSTAASDAAARTEVHTTKPSPATVQPALARDLFEPTNVHSTKPPPAAVQPTAASTAPERPKVHATKSPPPQPTHAALARSWTEMLASFMEQRNIRWGELIGGLLFVCSSIALVVSLRETLEKIPYFQFFIFVSISSAVFGVGLYAHHRWKLESTSRALLVIATLLVPLNFVALASMTKGSWTLLPLASELVSLAIFAWLVGMSAKILVPDGRWLTVAAVLGDSVAVVLAAQLVRADSPAWLMVGAGALPVALLAVAVGCYLYSRLERGDWRPLRLSEGQIGGVFTLLGMTAFATIVALGVVAAQAIRPLDPAQAIAFADVAIVFQRLSALIAMTAVPLLAGGLTVTRGSGRDKELAAYHLAGTIVALVAMFVMLAALALAWPAPGWLLGVAVLNAVFLLLAAFRWRFPILHAGVIACTALAYLIAFYLLRGALPIAGGDPYGMKMLRLMVGARSGTALAGLFVVLAAASELLARLGFRRHAAIYLGGSSVVAIAGLLLVTVHGIHSGGADALRAAILYGVYGAGSLALTARWRRLGLSYLGLALFTSAALWALWWQSAEHHVGPLWGAVLAIEALVMAAVAAVLQRYAAGTWYDPWKMLIDEDGRAVSLPRSRDLGLADVYRIPLAHVGEAAALLAAALATWTAWHDYAQILALPTPWPIVAAAAVAAAYFLLAWCYRSPGRTWTASLIALAGAVHALNYNYFQCPGYIGPNWTIALLGHATLALLVVTCLDRIGSAKEAVRRVFGDPLANAALLSSVLVLPALVFGRSAGSLWLACCFPWLAAVWLVLALRNRSAGLYAAHQAALAFAALAGTTAWMKQAGGWFVPARLPDAPNLLDRIASASDVLLKPWCLQAYGVALGLLSLVWIAVRILITRWANPILTRSASEGRSAMPAEKDPSLALENNDPSLALRVSIDGRNNRLLQGSLTVDWCIRQGVVAMAWLIAAVCMLAQVPRELLTGAATTAPAGTPSPFGPTAWVLLGVLAVMLVATLWERWRTAELVATLLLAATLPCLIAGCFMSDLAVASAARWTLAIVFAACSITVWGRRYLADACRRLHAGPFATGAEPPQISSPHVARGVLLATMLLPVLAITVLAAALQIGGTAPAGPLANAFFQKMGPIWSYLVPLALLIAGLVGYALRERSTGYAFSAGLVLELAVMLGYALRTTLAGRPFDAHFTAVLVQLFAITAAVWAIAWLIARTRFDVWRETPASGVSAGFWSTELMRIQIGMAIVGNVLVLGLALPDLALFPLSWQAWSVAAGLPLGWLAFALMLAALQLCGRLRPQAVGLCGMAVLGLLACTIGGLQPYWHLEIAPIWGYRALMLGWAVYALLVVAATWWVASLRTAADAAGPPQGLIRMAAVWVRVAGILAVLLGLKAAFWDEERLWAAAAIAVASSAGATMAVWRRREGWAFAAALGVNLAASLVVWHFELLGGLSFSDYWLRLVQANVIASAAVAVAWLAARKRLYELREMTLGESPLLAVQVLLPVAGNLLLAVQPVAWLMYTPSGLPQWMDGLATPQGWIGLLLAAAAAAWYLRQTRAGSLLHVLGGLAIGAGVLSACRVAAICRPTATDAWVAYHVLTTAWAAAGLTVFAIAVAGRAVGGRRLLGPQSLIQPWTAAIGTLTVALATLHAFHDPGWPWWAAGSILAVSLTAGLAALLLRKPAPVYVSGLLINLAGTIVWWAYSTSSLRWPNWGVADFAALVQANVLLLAIGSVVWSLLEFLPRGVPQLPGERQQPFSHLAAQLGAVLLGLVTAAGVAATLGQLPRIHMERLDWIALAGIAAATAVCLRDRQARFPLPTLYGLGLAAVGMGLLARQLAPRLFCCSAVDELAAYVLVTAAIAWFLPRGREDWFSWLQAAVAAVVGTLALWVSIDFSFNDCRYPGVEFWLSGRMAAVPGLLLLLLAAIVMAGVARETWRVRWQHATLAVGVALASGLGWAMLPLDGPAPWLHRSVILMVAAAAVGLLAGFGLKLLLPSGSDWRQRCRQAVPVLAGLAVVMLISVLGQEAALFERRDGAPLAPWAITVVIAALAGLIAACIAFAVTPALDPLRLSDRGRQGYVYAAETLAAAIGLHVWLTMPWLFQGYLVNYWMLIVMAVAFAGAGLSEWFHRRGLAVLSQPLTQTALLLPLLPAIGFWIAPMFEPDDPWHWVGRAPLVWFLMASFYGVLAVTRRSWKCTALAVLAANLGLWVALDLAQFHFWHNPQIFVIPLALAGLVAEYLNRERLSEAQSAAFRYLMLSAIYVSSTADMFIAGLGNSWALPLVLMVLSVAGMLAGISLRVRSFLFLGLTFLVLDVLSIIWHAAYDLHHTWIWYVCGIVLGAAILAMFAVFEKRRNDVLLAVDRLKGWAK